MCGYPLSGGTGVTLLVVSSSYPSFFVSPSDTGSLFLCMLVTDFSLPNRVSCSNLRALLYVEEFFELRPRRTRHINIILLLFLFPHEKHPATTFSKDTSAGNWRRNRDDSVFFCSSKNDVRWQSSKKLTIKQEVYCYWSCKPPTQRKIRQQLQHLLLLPGKTLYTRGNPNLLQ